MTHEQPTASHSQPYRLSYREKFLSDEENTVPVQHDLRNDFEFDAELDIHPGPPWFGNQPITNVSITGTITGVKSYNLDNGYEDPATVYVDNVEYEDIEIDFWVDDLLVLSVSLDPLTEGDMTWGRLVNLATRGFYPSEQPFYNWLDGNRDLSLQFPGADSLENG